MRLGKGSWMRAHHAAEEGAPGSHAADLALRLDGVQLRCGDVGPRCVDERVIYPVILARLAERHQVMLLRENSAGKCE